MALETVGWELSVTLIDGTGDLSTLTFDMVSSAYDDGVGGPGQLQTDVSTVLAEIAKVSDATVKGYRLSEVYADDAYALPAVTVHNEEKASVTVALADVEKGNANYRIPAPKIGLFTAATGKGANIIDTADADIGTFFAMFTAAGNVAYISDGDTLKPADYVVSGRRTFSKRKR